jgi:aldehyde dehydrogenase (NAD+)
LNVVVGPSSEIGDAFVQHPDAGLISFTGSTAVGRRIADLAATGTLLKRMALELGGNTPFIVLDDADLDQAVPVAVFSRFLHQGQICMSSNRIIVDARVHDAFVERFIAHVKTLKYGDPKDAETTVGPIINTNQLKHMLELMQASRNAGARQVLGAETQGLVLPPHIFVDVKNDMSIAKNETFGPIAPVIKVKGEERALLVANDTEYGLSSSVFTGDEGRGLRFAQTLQAGMTHINGSSVDDAPTGPFGGVKNSNIGRFGGDWIIEEFTTAHWITVQHTRRSHPF